MAGHMGGKAGHLQLIVLGMNGHSTFNNQRTRISEFKGITLTKPSLFWTYVKVLNVAN